ncbi:hypothetical protein N0B51_13410 [Tsuneonella sp. YG55]|uniref:Uncharacterized protein n=1 Tax=Tsuneonella litorea TaxID=2976475 RepID=A0A9X2W4M6_9SPHN|nr:hypothetical protein [Tsuneonella litorea]MCT2559975.1 hypothetical protein [Tsuneonella litorea]
MITSRPSDLFIVTAACAVLSACSLPRDPSGTQDRVERSGTLRLGIVEGASIDPPSRQTLARLTERTGARPEIVRGDSEALLTQLKRGKLDLVYGEFAQSSPWSKEVHFSTAQGAVGKVPKGVPAPRFAAMNGENGWIMAVGEASR